VPSNGTNAGEVLVSTPVRDPPPPDLADSLIFGTGEMAARILAFDWSKTPLGPLASWSPALRTTVGLMLANRFPLLLWWGPQYVSVYNDAYIPVLGLKHPDALGLPVHECWSEIWDILKPLIDAPFQGGPSTWIEDFELHVQRSGFTEETHFTVAYSPVPDPTAAKGIGGVLATVHEITQKIVAERRVIILRDLGAEVAAVTTDETCRIAAETLRRHGKDVPFSLLYLIDPDGKSVRLAGCSGIEPGTRASPLLARLDGGDCEPSWPLAAAFRDQSMVVVADIGQRFGATPTGAWEEAPHTAVVVPLRSNKANQLFGLMIVGVSARLKFDEQYRSFFELAAAQIATAIAKARAYEEERKRAEALAEIDRAKTMFFSNVSHEFRTPLTLMLGPLEDALAGDQLAPAERDRLVLAHRNSLRLLKLVNSLLDFSRIEAGRIQAVYQPTDLATVTAELASVFRSAIERAGLKLVVDCPALPEPAFVDREMWEKIVLNLISNALKFTFDGQIEVRLRCRDERYELAVQDTGIGIPAHELPRLFERFHRVAGARGRTHEGSGIGLALVQELVKLHGGSVTADSAEDRGSTFKVAIPRGRAHLPAQQVEVERTQVSTAVGAMPFVEEALRWLPHAGDEDDSVSDASELRHVAVPSRSGNARVLLADDNADMRDYVRRLLETRYDVEAVADGQAALDAIALNRPDVVLTDVMMPRLDGLQLLSKLRADPATSRIPIILLSARAGEESRVEGMQAGADDYLIKPFSARELLARIEAHVKMARFRGDAERALKESENRLSVELAAATRMQQVSTRLVQAGDISTLLTEMLDAAIELSHADMGNIQLLEHGVLRIVAQRGFGAAFVDFFSVVDEGLAACGAALQRGERIVVEDVSTSEIFVGTPALEVMLAANARAVQSTPLVSRSGRILGMFSTHYRMPCRPTDHELRLLDVLARQTADLLERKQAEQTQQLLVSELNHRVKNTLASVQAIVQHTLRRTSDPVEFASSFAGRVQSLARAHSLLSAATWQGADLASLIRDQLVLGPVDETRLTAWGPAVRLEAQTTLHVALMLHELATNASKYGAFSVPRGWLTIEWTVKGRRLCLRWEEHGGAPLKAPVKRGFGTTLIERSAKGEGGEARMSATGNGLVWEISLPLPGPTSSEEVATAAVELAPDAKQNVGSQAVPKCAVAVAGKRILVVEDEPVIALDIASGLEEAGAEVLGPASSAAEALEAIATENVDAALLDGNLRGEPVDAIAAALTHRKIPFLFVTGYGRESLPRGFAHLAVLTKPFSQPELVDAAATLFRQAPRSLRS
jgi:signal transduction histidine kinase/CheY-like chemotaxis protein